MSTSQQTRSFMAAFRMGICLRSLFILATVFGWPVVSHGQDQRCSRAVAQGIIDVGGYFTVEDRFQHAIVSNDGSLYEIFFDPTKGIFQSHLARFPGTVAMSAEYAPKDVRRQNIVLARKNGEIHHAWFIPSFRIQSRMLARIDGAVDVCAFYSNDTGIQRAVVLTASGDIIELEWFSGLTPEPGPLFLKTTLTNIPGATHVAGFFAKDDGYNIVLVSTSSGDVYEIFYKLPDRIGKSIIGRYSDIIDVGGFYTDDDQFRHAIIGTRDGTINELAYHPLKGRVVRPLLTVPGLNHLSGYATTEIDRWRHVIVGTNAGEVRELYFDKGTDKGFALLGNYSPEATFGEDPSPDLANGTSQPFRGSIAGLTSAIAGDNNTLYAVSLNAGVWKSAEGSRWQQLPKSPPLAYSIAVDPNNPSHLVVGERNGDSINTSLNRAGIWESVDGGNSWSYKLNARTINACNSQAIPSITFDVRSTIYAATDCGVVRKLPGGAAFEILTGTQGKGSFTAVTTVDVMGQTWVWGRTQDYFFLSRDAGATWEQILIPSVIGGVSISRGSRGDAFSLAAFDNSAFTIVSTDKGSAVIAYEGNAKTWSLEQIKDGDGTGLGGRRFVKSFLLDQPPYRWVLFAGTGQGVFIKILDFATAWKRIAETPWPLGPGDKHEFNPVSNIHSDIWDAHMTTYGAFSIWLGTDGGIYRTTLGSILLSRPGESPPYKHQNEGLHTHHVHTISLITEGMTRRAKIVYPTADNDEWLRNSSPILYPLAAWRTWGQQGDSNLTAADNGSSPIALIMRNSNLVHLTGFGDAVPTEAVKYAQTPRAFQISSGAFFRGQEFFNFIQTTKSELSTPLIDMVMLAKLPLAMPDPLGKTVLIRNRKFAANPNAGDSKLSTPDWVIEDDKLPDGAQRIWTSGGHADPVYYLYTEATFGSSGRLFRRGGAGQPWKEITPAGNLIPYPGDFSSGSTLFGPAFINPYNSDHLLVATVAGIKVSHDGGRSYQDDPVITALITGSGKYPLTGNYRGANGQNVVHSSQAAQMATLSQVTFYSDDPGKLVVAAPYTGVFYLDEACGYWQDLTPYLPTPYPAVPSVGIDHEAVYVALEGRSIYQIRAYEFAPRATYFSRDGLTGRQVARLMRANGTPLVGTTVTLTCANLDGTVLFQGPTTTDGTGIIDFPPIVAPPGAYVIHLDYSGAMPSLARNTTSFIFTL